MQLAVSFSSANSMSCRIEGTSDPWLVARTMLMISSSIEEKMPRSRATSSEGAAVAADPSGCASPRLLVSVCAAPLFGMPVSWLSHASFSATDVMCLVRTYGGLRSPQALAEAAEEVVEENGVTVLVEPKALFHIVGTTMDWEDTALSSEFVFNNPNITGTCGCGESFSM